jgi:hypothetical protein
MPMLVHRACGAQMFVSHRAPAATRVMMACAVRINILKFVDTDAV